MLPAIDNYFQKLTLVAPKGQFSNHFKDDLQKITYYLIEGRIISFTLKLITLQQKELSEIVWILFIILIVLTKMKIKLRQIFGIHF